jgi:hypothetical protein
VTASFNAVCHAVAYNLYRSAAGSQQLDAGRHAGRAATRRPTDGTNRSR